MVITDAPSLLRNTNPSPEGFYEDRALYLQVVSDRLSLRYKDFRHHNKTGPIAELIFIILSTRTEEYNYLRSYAALKRRFSRWESLTRADETAIAEEINIGGLASLKARQIKSILREINLREGRISLSSLRPLSDFEVEAYLTSLHGIGVKIARCIMLYAFGREVFPVDAHCWRVSQRLGIIDPTISKRSMSLRHVDELQKRIPEALRFKLHVNFISLGREICQDPRPKCSLCPLQDICPTASANALSR